MQTYRVELTPEKRLNIYLQAFTDFTSTNAPATSAGFCFYFWWHYDWRLLTDSFFEKTLPELYDQKPSKFWAWWYGSYWFKKGDKNVRAYALKKAIKIVEQKIKDHGTEKV